MTFTKQLNNNTAKLLKENHYYPFGLKHPYNSTEFDFYYNTSTSSLTIGPMTNSNRYQYNSKEWQNEFNLNLYDYGARMYDPAIGRWGVVDKYAEKYINQTPYHYAANNPIKYIDINGDSIKYANSNIQAYVEKYSSQTKIVNGKTKNNKNYNSEFAKVISELEADHRMFTFSDDPGLVVGDELGALISDGDDHNYKIIVPNYTSGDKGDQLEIYGGREGLLAEETYHGVQLVRGDIVAKGKGFGPGKSSLTGAEIDAKIFASSITGMGINFTNNYKNLTEYRIPTQLGLISQAKGDRGLVLGIITSPQKLSVSNSFGGSPITISYPPSYILK